MGKIQKKSDKERQDMTCLLAVASGLYMRGCVIVGFYGKLNVHVGVTLNYINSIIMSQCAYLEAPKQVVQLLRGEVPREFDKHVVNVLDNDFMLSILGRPYSVQVIQT